MERLRNEDDMEIGDSDIHVDVDSQDLNPGQQGDGLRQRSLTERRRLAKYGATHEPPLDDAVLYPHDDDHSFFAKGRDFESRYVNHKYTQKERETLATFESLDYLPSHSEVYKQWLRTQPKRLDWDRWLMMGFIGFSVGFVGFLLHQCVDVISNWKWEVASEFVKGNNTVDMLKAWGFTLGFSLLLIVLSSSLVVFLRPSAGGSGIPEVIGFLNGTVVRHIFNVKTMLVKFVSCALAVASGMPVGPEGPMIHLGSLVGAGLSQFKSDTLRVRLPFFERFRNSEDRRNFISAGAGAGIASAFGAPVGGLLFSMEEVSSFWNMRLSWQIFFCCMVSTFTTDLFNSAFEAFRYRGDFGLFKTDKYIIFQVTQGIAVNIIAFIPTVIIGIIGGVLGALFTFINLKFARGRKRLLSRIPSVWGQKVVRLLEPIIIIIVFVTVSVFLPAAYGCSPFTCRNDTMTVQSPNCLGDKQHPLHVERSVNTYTCGDPESNETSDTYNQVATLLFVTGEEAIHHLFSRNTHLEFDYAALFTVLVFYYFMACWASGTSISCGLVVPMLLIGALYGRMIGLSMVTAFGVHTKEVSPYWAWMDPGAFALVGSASFFGGVSRLTMSLTVIMMEITNDIQFLLLIMVAIMVSKWVGDFFTHPLYHALLELKCIPFLDEEPVVIHDKNQMVNLELYQAKHVMTKPPIVLHVTEAVARLAHLLLDTPHGGFPVSKRCADGTEIFYGFINRLEIMVLLKNEDIFISEDEVSLTDAHDLSPVEYHQLTLDKLENPHFVEELLHKYTKEPKFENIYLDMGPFINQSAVTIPEKFSLHRTYILFRTMGLRHLTVVDDHNRIVGIITRKDLMGFSLEEHLVPILREEMNKSRTHLEMLDSRASMHIPS
ncbi:chloride channel protein C-like isoform X2 [Lineus longissimus]|uniref:chloride channel protein C-like isoform X2 n=1 Tax=Lineus longissimus TaxID=88925 RepID=UPI002B4DA267